MQKGVKTKRQIGLAKRLVVYIILASSVVTFVLTGIQLYIEYKTDVKGIEFSLQGLENSIIPGLTRNLWNYDREQIRVVLAGLAQIRDMASIELTDSSGEVIAKVGQMAQGQTIEKSYPLIADHLGKKKIIGKLVLSATMSGVYQRMLDKIWMVLLSQSVKTFIVSIFILLILNFVLIWPLTQIVNFLKNIEPEKGASFQLTRKLDFGIDDELSFLSESINGMCRRIKESMDTISTEMHRREQMQAELTEVARNAGMAQVATGILHDINNILTSLMMRVQLIEMQVEEAELPDERKECFRKEIGKMNMSLDMIVKMVKMQQTNMMAPNEDISLGMLIRDVLCLEEHRLKKRDITIDLQVSENIEVKGQRHAVFAIMNNLIKNAAESIMGIPPEEMSNERRKISIHLVPMGEQVFVMVEDRGVGISEEQLKHMFQFGHTTKKDGHGFGLNSCKHLAQSMDGDLVARSDGAGKGATFTLILPMVTIESFSPQASA